MIVKQFIMQHSQRLARIDVELLLCEALAVPRSWLLAHDLDELSEADAARANTLIARRQQGEPVAHILGRRDFWDFSLEVTPATLIPRPDTEVIVEAALARIGHHAKVADIGTGTGAIAIAIARECPSATVFAGEFSLAAAQLAQRNIANNAPQKVSLWQGSWLAAIADNSLDMIVSNPPYIDQNDQHLSEGDVRFEPLSALVADNSGLADIQQIAQQAKVVLKPGGWLLLEHGWDQAVRVAELLQELGYKKVQGVRDYGGNDRVTLGRRPC
ncbi:peptide chain release factor N(5)-glutamine methyltransferase [Salinibius halmophilus]|uniref:peptide chain release factor N(5)-glutamine methyltransferase n=1 Tax=Salinibius halmophilus TaxID=1853216 RepID=UPI000E670237|nr:peptide chain release factor N(5)-glutamine methyltransferase [Salinibius halmophilus]